MHTLFGEGSSFKKLITWVSAIILMLPVLAYSTVEVVQAAAYNNADKYTDVDPSVPLKTSQRNPDNIVGLSMTEKKGVPIMRMNISPSNNDVIKKGDRLNISFNKKNVDTNKIKELASQDNSSLYDISKKGNKLVINFKKNATSGNYQEVFGIATKNVKASTKANATFAGKSIKIDNNNINSKYRAPQKQQRSNQTQRTSNNGNQQTTNNQGSQQAQTQSASSNDGQTQTSSSNGQAGQTQSSSQQQQQQATQQQTTQQQGQTTQQQTQNGTTQQQQANQSDSVTPSFSQAEDAVNDRTSIKVTGTATSDPTKDNQTDTSSNTNDAQTTQNDTNTNNSDQTAVSNNSETNSNSATTNTNNEDDQTESSSNVADNENNSSTAQTTTPTNNDVDTNSTDSSQATTNTNQTTANNSTQTTQPAVDQTEQQSTTTFEPQEVTTPSSTTSQTQASDNSGYIEIQNQGYVSPKDTLDNYLTSDHDLDNNNVQNNEDNYEDNSQFEAIYGHVQQKATNATDEELGEITKDLPSMWNYIGQNDSDSDTNGQVWNFHSTLSTGRDLFVTIDGTAQPDSSDVLQQQMPKLLRAMGQSIEPGALNEAVDIDALKRSQIYQDYLDGNYTGPTSDNTANTSDVINTVENHTTISLDKPTNGADITQLPTIGKVDPNVLLKDAEEQAKVNQNGTDTTTTDNSSDSADSQAEYNAIKQDTYNKMTPWASDDEKAEMLKSVPTIWNDAASKTDKNDKVGQFYNYVLNGSDVRQIYYTIDGRVIPNGNKYEKQLPNVIVSLGKDMKKGEFDQIVNNDILRNSQAYQDYQQQSQGNAATTAATTAATSAASPLGGLGLAPLLLGLPGLLLAPALLVPGLLLAPVATGAVLASLPVVALLAQPVILPALLALPALAIAPIALPAIGLGLPLLLGGKLLTLPIKLFNNIVLSTIGSVILTAPITIFNTIVGLTLGLINTLIGSIPLALLDFIAPIILNFVIISLMSQFVQLTTFNLLLLSTLAKALLNGAIDLALGLSFIGLPIALLKGAFDLFRLGLGLVNTLLLPVLAKIGTFLLLLPLGLLNTALLTMFNISIPLILGFITSLVLSTLVGSLTFLTLLVVKLLADLLKNGFKLLIGLVAAATIFLGLPVLIVGAQILNFFVLLIANAVGGLILWGLLTLAKSLMLAGLGIALFSLPLLGQFAINTIVKWSIRALIHIFRFFVGLFKVGARLVLSFVLGLLNAIAGIAKAASVITAVVSGIAAALTALIPVVGPVLALLPLLISLLSIANSLILTPIKLLLGFLNLVVLGLNLLAIPLYLFIRPLVSIGLALGAGLLSDILMPLLTLPLVLFNQLTLFNLIGLPLLLLGLFNTFVVLPLVLAAIGLAWAFGLPLILALGAFGLTAILGLLLLSSQLPIVALALLALPSLIPFFNLIMDTIFFAPLMILLASILNLFIGLPLMMLVDSIINLVIPFLVWLTAMLLLAPIFGPLAFLNPLTWINLPLLSAIGTFFTKLMLKLIALPISFLINGILSLIPASIAAFIVGLLRALFGGLPFLLIAPLLLLPIILNGFLTALIPGLNLFTIPAALTALFLGLPLVLLGLLNNISQKALLRFVMFVLTYLAANVLNDLLALFGVLLLIDLLTPLIFILKLLSTQFIVFPALWLGLPLLAQGITSALLWGWTFIKGFVRIALDIFNIAATLITLPLWTILPAINLLRRLALVFVALISLPLRLLKDVFDLIRAFIEIGFILAIPLLIGLPVFLLLLPITTFNFLALKFLNMLLPLLASVLVSLGLSLLVAGITFIALLVIHLFNKFLKLAARLVLLGAITLLILGALPILIGAAVLNFLLLAALNAFVGFNLWLITTLLNNLITAAFLLGLFLIPLVGQLVINTVVKWSIRAVIHLIRFFMGLFRLGTRLVLQFIIGLTNLVLGVAKGIAAAAAVVNLLLAPISLLVPVVGPLLFLLHLLRAGLAGINFLILLSLKFLAGLLNLLTLAGLLLSIPYWLFIRPLISELLALGAGVLSDIAMTLLTLPLVFFNQLTLFNLIGIPALLLKAFNNLVVLPLLINGIGLILAIGLPLALLLGALGLLNTLALGLLGLGFPLVALILLTLPGLIPFLNLNLAILNLIGLAGLILNGLKLLLLPLKILKDLINDFVLPLLIAGVSFLLLLPLLLIEGLVAGILNFLLSLIPALLGGLIRGLITLFFNGLPVFLFLQLFALLPAIITGLLTALIPGLNLLTIPLGLLALLALPLTVLGVINNVIQSLLQGLLASLLTQLFFNVITDLSLLALPLLFLLSPLLLVLATIALLVLSFLAIIIPAIILALLFLPIIALAMLALAPILLLLFLPLILLGLLLFIPFLIFGLLSSAVLVWFLAPIFLQIAVNPVADFVTFILLVWMMFEQPVLFWFFQFINTPLMFLSFIGMFVNWLNPLNWLFHIISIGALIGLPLTLLNDFLVLDFIKWSSLLTINFAAGLLAFITLSIAKLALINLNLLFIINTFLVTLPMIAYVWIVLVIGFVIVLATAILTIGINPIGIFEIWVMVPLFTAGAILLALSTMVIGLTLDVLMTLLQLPIIVGNLQFGLIMAALANPLATLIGINLLGTLGLTSLVLLFAGLFMLGQIWLPFTFGINSFLLYLVMGSPLFMTANFAGLVPVIGWIIELITDPLWMLIGIWGTALLTDNNFALFVHILIPLAFSAITGIMFLLALLPVALIILPLALIQSIAILGLLFGGVALAALLVIIPTVIFGILATATMLWFFAPILLQLLVNPIADFVAFVLLIFMMFEDPILFWWAFEYITVPMTLLTFIGMFVNWLNPLNYIFKAISALAILGIPALVLLALLSIDLLRLGSLLTINLFAGFPAFIFLTIAKWLMIGLGVLFFINTFVVTLPMIAYVWLVLLLGVVIIFVDALATLGINVPNIFTIWVMVPFFVIFAILIALTFIPVMLALDLADVLIALVPIVANLQLGLISAFLANPLVALLAANNFAILGISAIGLFLAGLFMLAHVWLPFTFGINSFILYFILGNPLWMLLQFAGLVPIIGWIVQIIVDIIWMALGLWGTALITDNNFALFIHIFVTLAFTTIPVMMLLLAVLPILLVVLPVGIIGSLIFFGLINLPILLFNLLLAIPVILYGVFSIGTLIWFLAPLLLQLAVNPIADFVAFQLLLYWAIENPIFFHVFKIITLPLMFFTFTGMFVNWLNPLNFLYHAINAFALLGIPVVALLTLLNLNLLRFHC